MSAPKLRLAVALAAALAAAGAHGYERSKSSQGACFYWQDRAISFHINAARVASSDSCGEPGQVADTVAIEAVRAGFRTWTGATQACTDLRLVDAGLSSSQNVGYDQRNGAVNENLVVFRPHWCSDLIAVDDPCWDVDPFDSPGALGETCANKYNCFEDPSPADRATIAVTTVTHNPVSGEIADSDIEFADWNGAGRGEPLLPRPSTPAPDGWYFTCGTGEPRCTTYGEPGCIYVDLQSNVTHEVGHFIGLAHPCDLGNADCGQTSPYRSLVMFPSAIAGDTSKRVLTADDRAGVCAIYPVGGSTSTCAAQKKSGGCASGGDGGILSALFVLAALARDPRRAPRV
jgi:hypothetical protein